ncbi:MAG: hypothetical protein AAF216_03200 [Pseudomonadota bacterium]
MAQLSDRQIGLETRDGATLGSVSDLLTIEMDRAGFRQLVFLKVGCHGFALLGELETIEANGQRLPGESGFLSKADGRQYSLMNLLSRLAGQPPGQYRQIVLLVTTEDVVETDQTITNEDFEDLLRSGSANMPLALKATPLDDSYRVTAMIYEFEKLAQDDPRMINPNGRLPASTHFSGAGLFQTRRTP